MIVVATGSGFAIVSTNAGYVYPQGFFGGTAAELGDTDDSMASVVYGALATVGDPAVPGTLYQSAPSDGTAIPADSTSSSWAAVTMALQPLATLDVSIANHAVGAVRV
jgi:hypothetical protein